MADRPIVAQTIHMERPEEGAGSFAIIVIASINGPNGSEARLESRYDSADDPLLGEAVSTLVNLLEADTAVFVKAVAGGV